MLEDEFFDWLLSKYGNRRTASSRKTNCLSVCKYEGDLDNHFLKDSCQAVISKLSYTTDDERHNRPPRHKIPIDGNIRNGTATLKQAVKLYVEFKINKKDGIVLHNQSQIHRKRSSGNVFNTSKWPVWELPTENEVYQLAQITTKYIKFLSQKIVERITQNNSEHYNEWCDLLLLNNVNPNLYLWEMSPCCFPGIRRHAGSKEIAFFRKQTVMNRNEISNALRLDDNDFPKQLWSFTFRGKQFGKSGPEGFSLAHLIDHKKSKNRMKEELEFDNNGTYSEPYYGLYTCPSNTAYIPNSLLKPTDFNLILRRLLFQKAESLYRNYCNILPPFITIPEPVNEKWSINNFQWGECVGDLDNINVFLDYRNSLIKNLVKE